MTGVLHQLGFLASYATEVFDGLFKEAQLTSSRIEGVGVRIGGILAEVPAVEQTLLNAPLDSDNSLIGLSGKLDRAETGLTQELFSHR